MVVNDQGCTIRLDRSHNKEICNGKIEYGLHGWDCCPFAAIAEDHSK